ECVKEIMYGRVCVCMCGGGCVSACVCVCMCVMVCLCVCVCVCCVCVCVWVCVLVVAPFKGFLFGCYFSQKGAAAGVGGRAGCDQQVTPSLQDKTPKCPNAIKIAHVTKALNALTTQPEDTRLDKT